MATNKFLGINSINVLKQYIDEQILLNENSTRLITLQVYKYIGNNEPIDMPVGGSFDPVGGQIIYPTVNWNSLKAVVNGLGQNAETGEIDYEEVANKLKMGSIYMSAGITEQGTSFKDSWSNPIKISGENGINVQFEYSHNSSGVGRNKYPKGVDSINNKEYVWIKYGDEDWQGPFLWACYAQNGTDMLYRYCVTATTDVPNAPASDIDPNWTNSAAASVTQDKPYMWMSYKKVPAGMTSSEEQWSEPILFGHYGMDGKDGLDGNIPAYSVTLYTKTDIIDGEIVKPEFICNEGDNIDSVKELNSSWNELPMTGNENSVWWYVVINVNGGGDKEKEPYTVNSVSEVMRFSAIDGNVQTSTYTKYLFYWSTNQTLPEDLTDDAWVENPEYKADEQDGSLWMKFGVAKIDTITGEEVMLNNDKPYSDPVKITGPRGPIAYDYRTESLFGAGTADKAPTTWKRISEVKTNDATPYIWEKRYLAIYKMKYADEANADGTYDVVEDKFLKEIGDPDVFRLSGLNGLVGKDGANGNRLNSIDYTTVDKNLGISNFDDINYFISNSSSDTHYVLNGNKFGDFVSGYTGKFVNIGTGNMIITAVDAHIVGSNTAVTEIIVKPQESIDLIGYNNNRACEFILIGKPVIENPVEEPGVLSETALLSTIMNGGEVKLGNNIELSNTPLIIENDVVIDLNGHTITAPKFTESNGDVLEGETDSYVFWVKDGNLTIKGNGKVIAQPAKYSMAVWAQGGNVTIESGEFRNGGQDTDLIYASANGHITINGGKFIAAPKGNEPGTKNDYCALNLKNADRATCSISVKGGHYYGFNPAENNSEPDEAWWNEHPNGFVADGFVSIKNGEWYSVIPTPEI